jgi:Arc/MetJ-type ribon-helix-helix transcriptional regulator
MAMSVLQARVPEGIIRDIDYLIQKGHYSSRSDVIRHAVRHLFWEKQVGIIPNTGDSVEEVRKIRKKLSKQIKSWEDVKKIQEEFKDL